MCGLPKNESPRVSTVLVQLSATLQDLEHLELFLRIGVSSDVHEVCASLLSPQQGRPPQCAICLLIQRGRCNFASLFGTVVCHTIGKLPAPAQSKLSSPSTPWSPFCLRAEIPRQLYSASCYSVPSSPVSPAPNPHKVC